MSDRIRKVVGRKRIFAAGAVSLAILAMLAWKTGVRLDKIGLYFREANWPLLIAALAFSVSWHMFLGADKWWRILKAQGAPVKYWEVFRVRLGSDPIRFATPFKVGEIVNAAYFGKIESFGFSRAAGSIAFDKALNFFGTVFWLYVGIVAMASVPTTGHLLLHSFAAAALLVLIIVPQVRRLLTLLSRSIHPKLGRFAEGVLSAFEEFSPAQKVGFLIYGIIFQLRPLIVCALLFAAFVSSVGLPSLQEFLAYGSVVILMSNVPLTFMGLGPKEAALVALFGEYASADNQGVLLLIGLMMSLAIHILPSIIGIPLMFPLLRSVTASILPPDQVREPAAEDGSAVAKAAPAIAGSPAAAAGEASPAKLS